MAASTGTAAWEKLRSSTVKTRTPGREYVGFATLPDQVHRKSVKKGFEFTLMVVGESGLGKSTLVNSLFLTDLYKDRPDLTTEERIVQTVEIMQSTVEIEEQGVRLKLTVVDTPGFGDAVNSNDCWDPIIEYIDEQFYHYYNDESGLNRKNITDKRVHCCLYFISPYGHGLRPIDIEFMKRLHGKVNIVPVVAKADCLTPLEVKKLKRRVLDEIADHGIKIYSFPDCDEDEDVDYLKADQELKDSVPFAVIGSNTVVEVNGKRVRGRLYPWGITEVENPKHCDFVMLRNMLIRTHMQDLKDITRDVHYENYRLERIQKDSEENANLPKAPPVSNRESMMEVVEKDRMLEEKDAELRKMQQMLAKMQEEIAKQQQTTQKEGLHRTDSQQSAATTVSYGSEGSLNTGGGVGGGGGGGGSTHSGGENKPHQLLHEKHSTVEV